MSNEDQTSHVAYLFLIEGMLTGFYAITQYISGIDANPNVGFEESINEFFTLSNNSLPQSEFTNNTVSVSLLRSICNMAFVLPTIVIILILIFEMIIFKNAMSNFIYFLIGMGIGAFIGFFGFYLIPSLS